MISTLNYLVQLGLSEAESKIYFALIENGPQKVKNLADIIKLKRTTIYFHLNSLISKGLVAEIIEGSSKFVSATPPERIKFLIDEKMEIAKNLMQAYPNILTSLKQIEPRPTTVKNPEIKYLKGIANARAIYDEAFRANEIRSFVKLEEKSVLTPDNADLFKKALKKNKSLKMWEIVYESPFSRRQAVKILSENKGYFYKFMPADLKWSLNSEDIVIFGSKVAIINYTGKVSMVVLQSPDFYNNFKEIFDFIWRIVPEP